MSDYKYYTPIALFDELLKYLPRGQIKSIVDISCGEFNLIKSALKKYPKAICAGVDIETQETNFSSNILFFKQDGREFAIQQKSLQISYDLILTNPPFGKLQKDERIFDKEKESILCSRYECEMMYANFLLTHEKSRMVAILPATFVEGDLYKKFRIKMAEQYEVKYLIKLPYDVFMKGHISAYAIIFIRSNKGQMNDAFVGNAFCKDSKWIISCDNSTKKSNIKLGDWVPQDTVRKKIEKKMIDSIFRGNISSDMFSKRGLSVLHCSSIFEKDAWKPLRTHCKKSTVIKLYKTLKYAKDGDIIINRIGKNAGFWAKYHGEDILISDCIIVVRGGINIEEYLLKNSNKGRLLVPIKGVATKYISMKDLLNLFFIIG